MKKLLAALLALITISSVALVACKKDKPEDTEPNNDDGYEVDAPATSDTGTDTGTGTGTGENNTPSNEFTSITAKTVYTMARVNLRSEPNRKQSSIVKAVDAGAELTAIATNGDWYKVTYEGAERYIVAAYVTGDAKDTQFTDVATDDPIKTLTIALGPDDKTMSVNLREVPVVFEDVAIVTVDNTKVTDGKPLQILKKNENGNWFLVQYEGKSYYVAINDTTKSCFNELKGQGGAAGG